MRFAGGVLPLAGLPGARKTCVRMSWRGRIVLLACAGMSLGLAAACAVGGGQAGGPSDDNAPPSGDGIDNPPLPPPRPPNVDDPDAQALSGPGHRGNADAGVLHDAGSRPPPVVDATSPPPPPPPPTDDSGPGGDPDATSPPPPPPPPPDDAGPDTGTVTGGPPDACPNPLGAGDLAVVEMMIASQVSAGDQGEWIEIQSTQNCSLNLNGLVVTVASGQTTFSQTSDLWLPANGIIVLADSGNAATNNDLPGQLLVFPGSPADVFANGGDTITLTTAGATVYAVTYPAIQLYAGETIEFPADCAWSDITSWDRWSYAASSWTAGFLGTPNADNTDVTCY